MTDMGVRLVWDRNDEPDDDQLPGWHMAEKIYPCPVYSSDSLFTPELRKESSNGSMPANRLIHGDNLEYMKLLLDRGYAGKIDLIYIDPPYLSQGSYDSRVEVGDKADHRFIARKVFDDSWGNSLSVYLDHIFPRLQMMRELLSPQGSIFVHLDWHVSHYVKLLLDAVFSPDRLVNEIVWCYGGGTGARRHFHRKHDIILWYAKSPDYIFNPQYRPYSPGTRQRGLTRVKGDRYHLHSEGAIMQDWWTDINKILSPTAHENLKFPTQKPLALLQRIISTASQPGSLTADFYCGSGTLAQVCQQTERNWIACDTSPIAVHTTMQRLIREEGRPFTLEKTGILAESQPDRLEGVSIDVYNYKHELIRTVISLEKCRIKSEQDQQYESPDTVLAFWTVDLEGKDVFSSNLQMLRAKPHYQTPLPLELTLSLPKASGIHLAVKAYDLWGREYMSRIDRT